MFEAIAESPSPLLDAVMPRLTRAADHSKLWLAIAAGARRRSGNPSAQRGAARGVLSLARDQPVHQSGGQAGLAAGRARTVDSVPLARRSPGDCRRRTRCRRAIRRVRRPSRSASGWRARRWAWPWRYWRVWSGCPGSRPACTTPATCSPGFGIGAGIAVLGARVVPPIVETPASRRRPAAGRHARRAPTAPGWCW